MALERELADLLFEQTLRASARWKDVPTRPDTPARRDQFRKRESRRALLPADPFASAPVMGTERVFGSPDFQNAPPDQAAEKAGRPVARVVLLDSSPLKGFGTGFLVAPQILLTNNHVLPNKTWARASGANFRFEIRDEGPGRGEVFELDPDRFFLTDAHLDFTFVAIRQKGTEGAALADYGLAPLIAATGKILVGQPVNIIQHPSGGPKKYVTTGNLLTAIEGEFLRYGTDTLPGSSGSPDFNSHWEVVGLHHSAVGPMRDGNIITRDGRVFTRGMDDNEVDWIANEGVRASVIVDALRQSILGTPEQQRIRRSILDQTADPLEAGPASFPVLTGAEMSQFNFTFTGPVTIHVGGASAPPASTPPPVITPAAPLAASVEGVAIDQNYAAREGYRKDFLRLALDLPVLSPANRANASQELKYHHFSIVMNTARRLAFYTAVNIDGKQSRRPSRSGDAWFFDPRLDRKFQIGEFLYANNPLDRGHLVRRLDPAWGSVSVSKKANDDTFHFTNCSPQHANLNQKIWNDLEDYLLDNADQDNIKLTVFTGPVFADDDPVYRGAALPRRFWKVAVMVDSNRNFLAAGFLQSQESMIRNLREADFLSQEMRTDQVAISDIEQLTGISFGLPAAADPLSAAGASESLNGIQIRPLEALEDIKLS